ncbi:hypothetical protein ABCS02_25455 [Microbacterium sp. X-17]|uniref:hypothetical protein n=1 Tax=Microbacterium sp. X-17 TaxID=3144404 RepID=UPI0031F5CCDC
MNFLDSLAGGLLGALLGVGIAYAIHVVRQRTALRRAEHQALENLVDDLHFRRALTPDIPELVDPSASEVVDDLALVLRSILRARDAVRDAREKLVPRSPATLALRKMVAALSAYLERQQLAPERYRYYLQECRQQLNAEVEEVVAIIKSAPRYVGEGSFTVSTAIEEPQPR